MMATEERENSAPKKCADVKMSGIHSFSSQSNKKLWHIEFQYMQLYSCYLNLDFTCHVLIVESQSIYSQPATSNTIIIIIAAFNFARFILLIHKSGLSMSMFSTDKHARIYGDFLHSYSGKHVKLNENLYGKFV